MSLGTILIVEDEPELQEILKDDLEYAGFKTVTQSNGLEALEYLTKVQSNLISIDAVISDINMPQLTGLELLKKLRENNIQIPFVIYSGYSDEEKIQQAKSLGAFDVIEKPYDPHVLVQAMTKASELGRDRKK